MPANRWSRAELLVTRSILKKKKIAPKNGEESEKKDQREKYINKSNKNKFYDIFFG